MPVLLVRVGIGARVALRRGAPVRNDARGRMEVPIVYGKVTADKGLHRWDVQLSGGGAILRDIHSNAFHQVWCTGPLAEGRSAAAGEGEGEGEGEGPAPEPQVVGASTSSLQLATGSGYMTDRGSGMEVYFDMDGKEDTGNPSGEAAFDPRPHRPHARCDARRSRRRRGAARRQGGLHQVQPVPSNHLGSGRG